MTNIELTGTLECSDADDVALVQELLPRHVNLTLAEAGCITFRVTPSKNSMVWDVHEIFDGPHSFQQHQTRVAASEWGQRTANIKRNYLVRSTPASTL